jgi:hypothetical protein
MKLLQTLHLAACATLLLGACAADPPRPDPIVAVAPAAPPPPAVMPEAGDTPAPTQLAAAHPAVLEFVETASAADFAAALTPALIDRPALQAAVVARPAGAEVGYLMLDLESGAELAAHNPDLPLIPASTTKLATALVALDVRPTLDVGDAPFATFGRPPRFTRRGLVGRVERLAGRAQPSADGVVDESAHPLGRQIPLETFVHVFVDGDVEANRHR